MERITIIDELFLYLYVCGRYKYISHANLFLLFKLRYLYFSEDTNKWHKKNQSELKWAQMHDNSTVQEKNKFKTWKNDLNESSESNNWNAKWNDKHNYNDSFKSGKGTKGSKNKIWGSVKSHSSDKNWSDRDSDTSSKGSGKHGKSSVNRGSYSKHESISGRTQSNKFNDRNNDGNYKSGKRETNSKSFFLVQLMKNIFFIHIPLYLIFF